MKAKHIPNSAEKVTRMQPGFINQSKARFETKQNLKFPCLERKLNKSF